VIDPIMYQEKKKRGRPRKTLEDADFDVPGSDDDDDDEDGDDDDASNADDRLPVKKKKKDSHPEEDLLEHFSDLF